MGIYKGGSQFLKRKMFQNVRAVNYICSVLFYRETCDYVSVFDVFRKVWKLVWRCNQTSYKRDFLHT